MEDDLRSKLGADVAFTTQVHTTTGAVNGAIIDSQGFESLTFEILSGTITTGDFTVSLEDGDDSGLADAAAVAADFLIGTVPVFAVTDDDVVKQLGYVGKKRYIRLVLTGANTPSGTFSGVAVKGRPESSPTA